MLLSEVTAVAALAAARKLLGYKGRQRSVSPPRTTPTSVSSWSSFSSRLAWPSARSPR